MCKEQSGARPMGAEASSGIAELGKEVRGNRGGEETSVTKNSRNGKRGLTTEALFDFAQGRLRTRRSNKAKSNRGLRGGRGSDSLCALRPTACAQAFGREEWVFVIRFPSPPRRAGLRYVGPAGPDTENPHPANGRRDGPPTSGLIRGLRAPGGPPTRLK